MKLGPVMLEGRTVRLEPLREAHAKDLLTVAAGPEIWEWMSKDLSRTAELDRWIEWAQMEEKMRVAYPFVVIDKHQGRAVGSTRYMDIQEDDHGVEIGWTWYDPRVWGTHINPEVKLLLLRHAFEGWGAWRVQFKTDDRNTHSQAAIRKLGAHYEGTLRNHRMRRDGTVRHTVVFSIIREEWPSVKTGLVGRLDSLWQ